MKYTPRPWRAEGGLSEHSSGIDIYAANLWIGCVHGDHVSPGDTPSAHPGFPSNEEAEANAYLIVAAPDLLEMLEQLMRYHASDNHTGLSQFLRPGHPGIDTRFTAEVKAAIAKATP